MNIYCLVTLSHRVLYENWFLRTLPRGCYPKPLFVEASPEVFGEGNWHRVVAHKFSLLERAFASEPEGQVFVLSDVDIRFYGPFAADLTRRMSHFDVLFQHNRPSLPGIPRHLCTGFMGIRNNRRSREFFQLAHQRLEALNRPTIGDQRACIEVLEEDPDKLCFDILPESYWSPGSILGRWVPGVPLTPPLELMLHHANHTVGIENKIQQLATLEEMQKQPPGICLEPVICPQ